MAEDDFRNDDSRSDQLNELFPDGVTHLDCVRDVIDNRARAPHQAAHVVAVRSCRKVQDRLRPSGSSCLRETRQQWLRFVQPILTHLISVFAKIGVLI